MKPTTANRGADPLPKQYTLTQLVSITGVDRQRLYRYLKKNKDIQATTDPTDNRTFLYPEEALNAATAHFAEVNHGDTSKTYHDTNAETIDDLRHQIADLKDQRAALNRRLDNAEQVNRAQLTQMAQLIAENKRLVEQLPAPATTHAKTATPEGTPDTPDAQDTTNDPETAPEGAPATPKQPETAKHGRLWHFFHG